ncbi:MAG: DUF4215 domain-containing protein [Proteobacteria bacterium]|nr:DUF4215 domain-containing protein [Pseudomonadota bacterium]
MKKKIFVFSLAIAMLTMISCGEDNSTPEGPVNPEPIEHEQICGNGTVEDGENCDDGNNEGGDGCSVSCKAEDGWNCPKTGGKCTKIEEPPPTPGAKCSNKLVDNGEECDDGNENDGDGCSKQCKVEDGWECPSTGGKCTEIARCGDKKLNNDEECDDGNEKDGDGCSKECTIEDGWKCPIPGEPCADNTFCGNEEINEGEACDEGDYNVDYGYAGDCATNCQFAHYCGDSRLDEIDKKNGEECDAGTAGTADQYNGCTTDCKRVNYCGDGHVSKEEGCDDGGTVDGDGCSADCQVEKNYACKNDDGKSVCVAIPCGNEILNENETCDDGNRLSGDGCSASCLIEKGYLCSLDENGKSICHSSMGNGVIDAEAGEICDDGNVISGDGCSEYGAVEPGWICLTPGTPCIAKACGDGIKAGTEECDDGNTNNGDGCSWRCIVESGYLCENNQCKQGRCGDGVTQVGEECDNDVVSSGAPAAGDGCSDTCTIEAGYACKTAGGDCIATECGDGTIAVLDGYTGYEQCDLGKNANGSGSGCSNKCRIFDGWHCDKDGKNCTEGICGDGVLDVGEECDDGNHKAADGCSPSCKSETGIECKNGSCKPLCGDGVTMWMLDKSIAEECDDGNLINGDGCSSECKLETGFQCTEFSFSANPEFISLPVTYRDFRSTGRDTVANCGTTDGFITAELIAKYPETHWTQSRVNTTITDFDSQAGCASTGYVLPDLDTEGKPVLKNDGFGKCFSSRAEYAMWYRNTPGINKEVKHRLYLWRTGDSKYYFTSYTPTLNGAPNTQADGKPFFSGYTPSSSLQDYFLPLGTTGFGPTHGQEPKNYSFTSEVSTYFQYKGGESLTFSGDDDLWVFLNGHLFVDLGGLHGVQTGTGTLKAEKCEFKNEDNSISVVTCDKTFNVYDGGIYEMKLFHAERNATGSNFSLTLTNFLNSGTAECAPVCGDGLIRGSEECDLGDNHVDDEYAQMAGCVNCKLVAKCGNGKLETGEVCDAGHLCKNSSVQGCTYHADEESAGCNTSCQNPNCNNGSLDTGESCDCKDDVCQFANPSDKDKTCLNCKISGCGDGIIDKARGEECDDGNASNEDMCTTDCKAPYCGDGLVSEFLGEVCDDGINDGSYGGCGFGCTYRPPFCGDGNVDPPHEVCDDGINDGSYGGCMPGCKELAPHCGDGIPQPEFGEACDNGKENGNSSCSIYCRIVIN